MGMQRAAALAEPGVDTMLEAGMRAQRRLVAGARAARLRGRRMHSTVLIVEDDHNIGSLVRTYLERDGYGVVWVRSGEEALAELERHPLSLVVLDVGLPGIDGFEVCRRVRARSEVPVIMLTARDEEVDRVLGLELGADDYVPKPFSPRELVARVAALLRRAQPLGRGHALERGALRVDFDAREVAVDGRKLTLTPREFDLLAFLARHPGRVVSRDELLRKVWGYDYLGETRTVDVHVRRLRMKLGEGRTLIETVTGAGYKFVAAPAPAAAAD